MRAPSPTVASARPRNGTGKRDVLESQDCIVDAKTVWKPFADLKTIKVWGVPRFQSSPS